MAAASLRLPPFTLRERLGAGAHAELWFADHLGLPVVVKVARPGHDARLVREAERMARWAHPHLLLPLHEGRVSSPGGPLREGAAWLAVEAASGKDLAHWVEHLDHTLGWEDVAGVLAALLSAVAVLHADGFVHGDLAPANVLMGTAADPRPGLKLADLGCCVEIGAPPEARNAFSAPEAGRAPADPRADVYAVGAIAWWLVGGLAPSAEMGPDGTLPEPFLPFPVPDGFVDWMTTLLDPDPRRRPVDAGRALATFPGTPPPAATWGVPRVLLAAGAGLAARRVSPAHGHEALLATLLATEQGRIHIAGAHGSGRSTLLRAFVRTKRMAGGVVFHGAPGRDGALAAMLRTGLQRRFGPGDVATWGAALRLAPRPLRALQAWLHDGDEPGEGERYSLVRRCLRPVDTVALEAVDTWIDGAGLARLLRDHPHGGLVVTTGAPTGADTDLRVPPLDPRALEAIVTDTLPVGPKVARLLAARADGNPLALRAILQQVVRHPETTVGFDRVRIAPVDRWASALGADWRQAVNEALPDAATWFGAAVLAALGAEASRAVWTAVVGAVSLPATLVVGDADTLRFVHPFARAAVEAEARARGIWAAAQRACFHTRGGWRSADAVAHLVDAELDATALGEVLDAAQRALDRSDYTLGRALAEGAAHAPGASAFVPRATELRLRAEFGLGELDRTEALARKTADEAWGRPERASLLLTALRFRGMVARERKDRLLAHALLRDVEQRARELGDATEEGWAMVHRSALCRALRRPDEALALARGARVLLRDVPGPGAANALLAEAEAVLVGAGAAAALPLFLELERTGLGGNVHAEARAQNALGDVLRDLGQPAEAAARYERSRDMFESIGATARLTPVLNLALLAIGRADWGHAAALLSEVRAESGQPEIRQLCALLLLAPTAAREDWGGWDQLVAGIEAGGALPRDPDVAEAVERAWTLVAAGGPERQGAARRLAIGAWRAAGLPARATLLEEIGT